MSAPSQPLRSVGADAGVLRQRLSRKRLPAADGPERTQRERQPAADGERDEQRGKPMVEHRRGSDGADEAGQVATTS